MPLHPKHSAVRWTSDDPFLDTWQDLQDKETNMAETGSTHSLIHGRIRKQIWLKLGRLFPWYKAGQGNKYGWNWVDSFLDTWQDLIPVTQKLALQWAPCRAPGVIGSAGHGNEQDWNSVAHSLKHFQSAWQESKFDWNNPMSVVWIIPVQWIQRNIWMLFLFSSYTKLLYHDGVHGCWCWSPWGCGDSFAYS